MDNTADGDSFSEVTNVPPIGMETPKAQLLRKNAQDHGRDGIGAGMLDIALNHDPMLPAPEQRKQTRQKESNRSLLRKLSE